SLGRVSTTATSPTPSSAKAWAASTGRTGTASPASRSAPASSPAERGRRAQVVGKIVDAVVRVGATGRRHHVRGHATEAGRLFAGCRVRVHGCTPPRQADEAHRGGAQPADEAFDARRPVPV